jgi:hypothetical protein
MLKRFSKLGLMLVPALLAVAVTLFATSSTNAATITVPLVGTARPATTGEVTTMSAIDAGTTIPGRGNVSSLLTSGWNVNPNRDLTEGFHELGIVTWAPVDLPACASSIRTKINTTIERRGMDITTQVDSLEWSNAIFRGGPTNPEDFYLGMRDTEGRLRTFTYGGTNPLGEDVPSNQSGNYLISNAKSSIDTTYLTRADLASGNLFNAVYLDAYSSGPHNVSWFVKINSAEVTYDDSACGPTTPTNPSPTDPTTPTPKAKSPKTGNLAVATLVTATLIAATLFAARIAKLKLHKKANSTK